MTRVPPHKRDCGMVFQSYALFPDMNVFGNVAVRCACAGSAGPRSARAWRALWTWCS